MMQLERLPMSIFGATPEGKKELIGFQIGMRESCLLYTSDAADE